MKKIMFNDRYGLTDAVIEGRKTMTRRIIIPQPDFLSDNFGWAKRNNGDVILPKYGVNEVVAVAQIYEAAGFDPEYSIEGMLYAKKHAGWRNKMFVSAKYMPHQIRITGIKCEQWFIAEEAKAWVNQGLYAPIGSFEKCLLEHRVGIPARKATVEEIIEHFKKREK